MSDNDIHHSAAREMREAGEMREHIDQVNKPLDGSSSAAFGQGLGSAAGYAVFFGMVGALVGGLLGRSLMGAVLGAVVFGAGFGAVALVGRLTSGIWNRGPVIVWVVLGAVAFFFLGDLLSGQSRAETQ